MSIMTTPTSLLRLLVYQSELSPMNGAMQFLLSVSNDGPELALSKSITTVDIKFKSVKFRHDTKWGGKIPKIRKDLFPCSL